MAGQFPPDFRARLLERIEIAEVVGARVQLKKAGGLLKGLCPFHTEKTPSFVVTPSRQTYHCFGCGAHGNAIDFLIEHDRLGFREAVEELAQQAGLELPSEADAAPAGPDPRPLYLLLEQAAALFQQQLREHPQARRAVDYLRGRGLSGEVAARFGLGFAPPGWDFLLKQLGQHPDAQTLLERAGLVIERDGRRYDRFRNRVMFPIRDRRGRVIGFGGRLLDDGEPKYLNSPENLVFHKGRELYGLFEAQQANRQPPRLLVVEGYMDVIALAQFGVPYAVATLGTATTPEHLTRLLRSAAPELVFCFDGDRAGRDAAWKALKIALPQATGQTPIRFLLLPEGEDPDSLIRQEGAGPFEQRMEQAMLLSDFLFEHLTAERDLGSDEGRASLDAAARPLLNKVPVGTFRDLLEQRLAKLTGVASSARQRQGPSRTQGRIQRQAQGRTQLTQLNPMRRAIALLLDDPTLAPHALAEPGDWREIDSPGVRLLEELLEVIGERPGISSAALREHWRERDQATIVDRLSNSALLAHIPPEGKGEELAGAIRRLNRDGLLILRQRLLSKASSEGLTAEERTQLQRSLNRAAHTAPQQTKK
ncbi:DNA primase [Halochromatium salexigens]|uniref:DNA primase n=1 Tax=Halochromatium salexigens TaxID=49447 RepID=A0AAJ0UG29_HALSE|nr:DNA primase [Halochromatium salexigens]MBK5930668.1 DNA primase [Halochromatium salexigens]